MDGSTLAGRTVVDSEAGSFGSTGFLIDFGGSVAVWGGFSLLTMGGTAALAEATFGSLVVGLDGVSDDVFVFGGGTDGTDGIGFVFAAGAAFAAIVTGVAVAVCEVAAWLPVVVV